VQPDARARILLDPAALVRPVMAPYSPCAHKAAKRPFPSAKTGVVVQVARVRLSQEDFGDSRARQLPTTHAISRVSLLGRRGARGEMAEDRRSVAGREQRDGDGDEGQSNRGANEQGPRSDDLR
jgi:hypothetical protein